MGLRRKERERGLCLTYLQKRGAGPAGRVGVSGVCESGEGKRREGRSERRQPTVALRPTAGDGGDGALGAPASRYE